MSALALVEVLGSPGRRGAHPRREPAAPTERPLLRLAAFAALGLYGVIRWSSLLAPAPTWRLLGLLALALLPAACGPALGRRGRPLTALVAVVAALASFPLAGVPLAWATHMRIAVTANGIGKGLSALPRALVPYNGVDEWVRIVTLLGAGVLLLCAGLVAAFAPRDAGDLRRGAAALPLIALAVVPSTILRPQLPYLDGLVLFGLVAAFVLGERVRRDDLGQVLVVCALAGAGAMVAAPALDGHKPWIDYRALSSGLSPGRVEQFDWSQRYGPLNWPRTGREVLDVHALRPDYWKAENLDLFDGRGWAAWAVDTSAEQAITTDPSALARWTQTLKVTIRGMSTSDVVAAGFALQAVNVAGAVVRGVSPGTWTAGTQLGPGDSYLVRAYSPAPSAAELAAAGTSYPTQLARGYLSLTMPQPSDVPAQEVVIAPFRSRGAPEDLSDPVSFTGTAAIVHSPYARAFQLARRLASRSRTPYAFVISVERHLSSSHGYAYDEHPPTSAYPLATFLFADRVGYCQQFAGAMALLLRMGGVPARVAAGFTTGAYDSTTRQWVVSDLDAHAWVEAWFPRYGWVRFDPTPAAAPARGGRVAIGSVHDLSGSAPPLRPAIARHDAAPAAPAHGSTRHLGGSSDAPLIAAVVVLLALSALAAWLTHGPPAPCEDELLVELERALARSGRPITGGVTLAALEHRFRASPEAASYIRAIRLGRFGGRSRSSSLRQRRALRAQLRAGLGFTGSLRALWALPPRWRAGQLRWQRRAGA